MLHWGREGREKKMEYIIKCVGEPLKKFLFEAISDTFCCKKNVDSLKEKVRDLDTKEKELLEDIKDAEREGKRPTETAQKWLQKLKKFQDEAKEVETQFDKMCSCLPGLSADIVTSCNLSGKARKLIDRADKLLKELPQPHEVAHKRVTCSYVRWPSIYMVGRDAEWQRLQELVDDSEVRILGIHGMAGVGKTTLLKNFQNGYQGWNGHHVIWVDLNGCRSVMDAQKAVAEELELTCCKDEDRARARQIYDYLRTKPFVLILENVWKPVRLSEVGIPVEEMNSKVIVETRIESVCVRMEAKPILEIKCLKWDDAWSLFKSKAGERLIGSDKRIREQAEILVKKCGVLPLALEAIGRYMATKRTHQLWKDAVNMLEDEPEKIEDMKDHVLCKLRASYDNLSDYKLKTILLYCILYKEHADIYKQAIIDYCIGEGVLDNWLSGGEDVCNRGMALLDELRGASMLETGQNQYHVKVHPMIRVLALWIEGGGEENQRRKWLVRPGRELNKLPNIAEWGGVERISLMDNDIKHLSRAPPDCSSLVTLLLQRNPLVTICEGFFSPMKNLRVLDVSHNKIEEIPTEVGDLIHLQYLDFCNTHIRSLPQELGNLVNLRFLLLSFTHKLASIPEGLISRFKELRVLKMYFSYEYWRVGSVGQGGGIKLGELQHLERLKILAISINTVKAFQKLAEPDWPGESINKLELKLCPGLTTISTAHLESDYKSLEVLAVCGCVDLESVKIDTLSLKLDTLILRYLPNAKITWKSGCLTVLRTLIICNCGKGMRHLIHCDDQDDDEGTSNIEIDVLPNLQQLMLISIPELESLTCIGKRTLAFPSLETLHVEECPKLKRIPTNSMKLQAIEGDKRWWNRLEWPEGDDVKSRFQDMFKEIKRWRFF